MIKRAWKASTRSFWGRMHRSVALMAITMLGSCAQGIVVGSYQVDNGRPISQMSFDDDRSAYWSAYVEIEGQDIPRLWKLDGLDYALITAEVSIPTSAGPLVRSVPLFTIEKGMIKYESGVDLLKKMPLHTGAREQVTFKLEVTLLANIEALKAARKILATVSTLAKPFLSNYPLASKILESSLPLIDEFAKPSKKPASSAKTAIVPERLFRSSSSSPNQDVLFAYFLVPQRKAIGRDGTDKGEDIMLKPWLIEQLGLIKIGTKEPELHECADKEGYLCTTSEATPFDSRDEILLWVDHNLTWTNLLERKCTTTAEETFGRFYKELLNDEPIKKELDRAHDTLSAACQKWVEMPKQEQPDTEDVDELSDQKNFRMLFDMDALLTSSYEMLAEHLRDGGNPTRYIENRVDQVAYVTVKFKRYAEVHDPFMIVDSAGNDCNTITTERIAEVQEYIRENESLFLPEHVDYARSLVTTANGYLELVEIGERGAYAQALGLIATHIIAQDRYQHEKMRSAESQFDEARQEHERIPPPYERARKRLRQCFDKKLALPPFAELERFANLYVNHDHLGRSERLDLLVDALDDVAVVLGDQPAALDTLLTGKLSDSPIARALFDEAQQLRQEELALARNPDCEALKSKLIGHFSKTCTECLSQVETKCKDLKNEVQEVRRSLVEQPQEQEPDSPWDDWSRILGETR